MKRPITLLCVLLTGLMASPGALRASSEKTPLVIVADPWCPYTCEAKGEGPGLLAEALQKMLPNENWRYQSMAWSRALFQTRKGDYLAALGATEPDSEGLILVSPALSSRNCFYTKRESQWTYLNPTSLKDHRLGVITGYTYGDPIDSKESQPPGMQIQAVSGSEPLQQNVQKVLAGRIDSFIEDENVANYTIATTDLAKLRVAGCLTETGITIGFSPKHPRGKELAETWNKKWPEFSKGPQWQELLKKYKVKPNQPEGRTAK